MKKNIIYWVALSLLFVTGCQKELSFELGNTPGKGSLKSDISGDCLPKTVNGTYEATKPLVPATNTISVDVNVTSTGTYIISTDTVNGYFFRATGTFTALGVNTVTLRASGTPFAAGINNFVVSFDTSFCDIQVTVLPAGAGGPAVFALTGAPGSCTGAVVNGTYATGVALGASNTASISVNVTMIGTYSITTTFQGMTFAASGAFLATGPQTVTLSGSGTPSTTGLNTIPITVGSSTCSFPVTVSGPAIGTLGGGPGTCTPATPAGIYRVGDPLTAGNTVQIQISVTAAGVYNITSNSVTGFSFAGTGTVAAGANQPITLTGTGTPTTAGVQNFTVTFGSSTCSFSITVLPPLSIDYFPRTTNSNWSYEIDDDPVDSLYRTVIAPTLSAIGNTYNILMETIDISGGFDSSGYYRKSGGDYFEWIDIAGSIGFDPPAQWTEYTFLKDNVAVGTSWTSNGITGTITIPPPTPLTIRFKYSILQKDVTVTLTTSTGTATYNNVIVVKEEYESFTGGIWVPLTSSLGFSKSYYARGIGLIKFEYLDGAGTLVTQVELRRSQVF
jgi:hypothetical protein